MEGEIDLRKYFRIVARRWQWIGLLTVVAALAAFVASSLMQPMYEATSLIVVMRPRYLFQFDPRIQTLAQPQQPYKAYQDLAISEDVLRQLADRLSATADAAPTADLAGRLRVQPGADQTLVRLTVTDVDPRRAQAIANAWAEVYVDFVNTLSQPDSEEIAYFEEQANRKLEQLQEAEQAAIDFEQNSRILVLETDLDGLEHSLSNYIAIEHTLATMTQDAGNLRARIAQREAGAPVSIEEALAALLLSANTYNTFNAQAAGATSLQVNVDALAGGRTAGEQAAALEDILGVLEEKSDAIRQQIAAIEQNILDLQETQREAEAEHDQLLRKRDVARDAWLTLARKLDEARLASESSSGEVQLASQAALPAGPASPRRGVNTILGGALGLALGVIAALATGMRRPAEANG